MRRILMAGSILITLVSSNIALAADQPICELTSFRKAIEGLKAIGQQQPDFVKTLKHSGKVTPLFCYKVAQSLSGPSFALRTTGHDAELVGKVESLTAAISEYSAVVAEACAESAKPAATMLRLAGKVSRLSLELADSICPDRK